MAPADNDHETDTWLLETACAEELAGAAGAVVVWLPPDQVLRAGITDILGIVNIADIATDIADIATDIADIMNTAGIADRMLRTLRILRIGYCEHCGGNK